MNTSDVISVFPKDMRPGVAPVRDNIAEAMAEMFNTYRTKAAYTAEQSDPQTADDIYLDGFGKDYEVPRLAGESDAYYRVRMFDTPSLVTPTAIIIGIQTIIDPYTTESARYLESELDCAFVTDGTADYDTFVGAGPYDLDRLYIDDIATNSGYARVCDPGGFWVFDGLGRYFVIRIPDLDDADTLFAFISDSNPEESFIADGSDTSGAEADGTDVTFVFGDNLTAAELYDLIVSSTDHIKGQGIRFQVIVDV